MQRLEERHRLGVVHPRHEVARRASRDVDLGVPECGEHTIGTSILMRQLSTARSSGGRDTHVGLIGGSCGLKTAM